VDLRDLQTHLDSRFDRLEDKVDNHLERISKAESSIEWIRGQVNLITALVLAVAGFFATAYFQK